MRVSKYVRADLISSLGVFKLDNVSITETVNAGCTWTATVIGHTLDPMSVPEGTSFRIRIKDGSDVYTSPPLVIESPSKSTTLSGKFGVLSGIDRTTWLLSRDDLSFDTFVNQTSKRIIDVCAAVQSVSVFGVESFPISEEDVKNSKILDVITRLLEFSAQGYFIRKDGAVQAFPITYKGPVNLDLRYEEFHESISYSNRVDSLKIEKTARISGGEEVCFRFDSVGFKTVQLPVPLYKCTPVDRSAYGYSSLITTFNGGTQGKVTGIWPFMDNVIVNTGPQDFTLPSTHATIVVNEPHLILGDAPIDVKVCFSGTPVDPSIPNEPIQIQAAFRRQIGSGSRPATNIWTDTNFPNPKWIVDHALGYMIEKNKGYHPIAGSGPMNLTPALLQQFTSPGHSTGIIQTFTHSFSAKGNSAKTSVSGYVPYPTSVPAVTPF